MPKYACNEIEIYYEIHGEGYPLVLIAGLGCDISVWDPILDLLKRHFKIIIFDNRGVGRSSSPSHPYTISDMALDTWSLIAKLELHKPHVLGHSMGGCILQEMVRYNRDKLGKIIISNSCIKLRNTAIYFENFMLQIMRENVSRKTLIEAKVPWIFSSAYLENGQQIDELVRLQLNHPYPQTFNGFQTQLEALFKFNSTSWFQEIQGPALIIGSDEDILCPGDSERLANHIKDAKFVEFHRVGHSPIIEKPQDYVGIIANYLNP